MSRLRSIAPADIFFFFITFIYADYIIPLRFFMPIFHVTPVPLFYAGKSDCARKSAFIHCECSPLVIDPCPSDKALPDAGPGFILDVGNVSLRRMLDRM